MALTAPLALPWRIKFATSVQFPSIHARTVLLLVGEVVAGVAVVVVNDMVNDWATVRRERRERRRRRRRCEDVRCRRRRCEDIGMLNVRCRLVV